MAYTIDSKMFKSTYLLYNNSQSCIKLKYMFTSFFDVGSCVKQDDSLSPLLFSIFINDLARDINSEKCGARAGIDNISNLLYAEDIVLLVETPNHLHILLKLV